MFDAASDGVAFLIGRYPDSGAVVTFALLRVLPEALKSATSTERLLRCCQETLAVWVYSRWWSRAVNGGAKPDDILLCCCMKSSSAPVVVEAKCESSSVFRVGTYLFLCVRAEFR